MILELYIDKHFLKELNNRANKDDEIILDFVFNFLKKLRGVRLTLNTTFEEFKDLYEEIEYFGWLPEIAPPILDSNWINEIEILSQGGAISKLFLLSNNIAVHDLEQKHGYLYITNDNLIEKWAAVRVVRDVDFFSANKEPAKPYWEQFENICHPFNSILIFDNYILSDKSNQNIENNLIPLLKYFLSKCCSSENQKELSIISNIILEDERSLFEHEKVQKSQEILQNIFANEKVEVVKYDNVQNRLSSDEKEHDRIFLTNYIYLEAGGGFSIYDSKGKANKHLKIAIRSIFKNAHRNVLEETLKNIVSYVKNLKEDVKIYPPLRIGELPRRINSKLYFPSKDNIFLNHECN